MNTFKSKKKKKMELLPTSKLNNIELKFLKSTQNSNITEKIIYLLLMKLIDIVIWKKGVKNIFCTKCEKYMKLKKSRISYIPSKKLVLSASSAKCYRNNNNTKIVKREIYWSIKDSWCNW